MADINNNDIWIDVETLAKLKNITRRAVRLALNQNKYEYKVENIRGGKTYKIKLSQKVNVLVILVTLVFELTILIDFKL